MLRVKVFCNIHFYLDSFQNKQKTPYLPNLNIRPPIFNNKDKMCKIIQKQTTEKFSNTHSNNK